MARIWHSVSTSAPGRACLRTLGMCLAVGALGHGVTDAGVGVSGGGGDGRSRQQGGRGGGGGGGGGGGEGGNCQRSAM